MNICGTPLAKLSRELIEDQHVYVFIGINFVDLRRKAAYELFELYYPDEYRIWNHSVCDGLIFDCDRFLDSPCFFVEEVTLAEQTALLIAPR